MGAYKAVNAVALILTSAEQGTTFDFSVEKHSNLKSSGFGVSSFYKASHSAAIMITANFNLSLVRSTTLFSDSQFVLRYPHRLVLCLRRIDLLSKATLCAGRLGNIVSDIVIPVRIAKWRWRQRRLAI